MQVKLLLPCKQEKEKKLINDNQTSPHKINPRKSPVQNLVLQNERLKPGLGTSKPPKKKARKEMIDVPAETEVRKPKSLKCKQRKGSCTHEIIFGEHYNRKAWNEYAEFICNQSTIFQLDSDTEI